MNKVIVTGLALANIGEETDCKICNYNIDWIVKYPSVLLWIDKIILSPDIRKIVDEEIYPDDEKPLVKSLKLIFEVLEDRDMIEIKDPKEVLSPNIEKSIINQTARDRQLLPQEFPNSIHVGNSIPGQISINNREFCAPMIHSFYVSLILARAWDASCLFSDRDYYYWKYKFGLSGFLSRSGREKIISFHKILQTTLPEKSLFPHYVYSPQCKTCANTKDCSETYLSELKKNINEYLEWRNYDELYQIREVITRIIGSRGKSDEIFDAKDIITEFKEVENQLSKLIHSLFPKVKRWTNMTTMLSVPIAVVGVSSGSALLTTTGGALAGASVVTKELIDFLSSKYQWVGFLNRKGS